jgi:hypothetical protein
VRTIKSTCEAELEERHGDRVEKLHEYQRKAFRELGEVCARAHTAITKYLLPNSPDQTATAFYYKLQGDIFRYEAECAPETEVQSLLDQTKTNYDTSLTLCGEHLPLRHPLRLSVILNNAVFEYEHMQRKENAAELVRTALAEIGANPVAEIGDLEPEILSMLEVMNKNLGLWSGDAQP